MTDNDNEACYHQTYTAKGFDLLARAARAKAALAARAAPCQTDGCQFARATAAEARMRELEAGLMPFFGASAPELARLEAIWREYEEDAPPDDDPAHQIQVIVTWGDLRRVRAPLEYGK